MGHSDSRTLRGYVHIASELVHAATQRMGGALFVKAPERSESP
ncbi:hypothetical protein Abr02nite_51160 [Paractinoplanes brasiliensis]|nr:hypothetical protein Abr02nite_51160 [Actinoplanes brasiliensis]